MDNLLYHLLPENEWNTTVKNNVSYYPKDYDKDGFIHMSPTEERLVEIANKYYTKDPRHFVVVIIPESRINYPARIVWEEGVSVTQDRIKSSSGRNWPHLYDSGITKHMVTDVYKLKRDTKGYFYHPH